MATTKHEKVSIDIPHDLFLNILSKLPIKSLKRFSCVTPTWADLLESPNFMTMYLHNFFGHNDHDTTIFLRVIKPQTINDNLFMLCGERFENKVMLDWPRETYDDEIQCHCNLGPIVNGIVCFYNIRFYGPNIEQKVVLWNLSSNEIKVIPSGYIPCPFQNDIIPFFRGFGYDNFTNDYKIIRAFYPIKRNLNNGDGKDPRIPSWELYSLKSNSWKTPDIEMPYSGCINLVYLNGMCHWWGNKNYNENEWVLVSFNFSDEVFYTTRLDWIHCYGIKNSALVVMNDSIAMITMHKGTTCFEISILGELGVTESWTKIFTIGPLPCDSQPIGGWNKGKMFFRKNDGELYWFDLSTQVIEEIGVKDQGNCQIATYKESLLPIGWINS